uniref:Secreted protein n=1 Tax=Cannabis sativa TaxID=3483 RepID=A0A803PJ89_CANSA
MSRQGSPRARLLVLVHSLGQVCSLRPARSPNQARSSRWPSHVLAYPCASLRPACAGRVLVGHATASRLPAGRASASCSSVDHASVGCSSTGHSSTSCVSASCSSVGRASFGRSSAGCAYVSSARLHAAFEL